MIRNFFINSFRNMARHSGYLILNITGLTIGVASFLLITLYVLHELSYDRFNSKYESIYRIKITGVMAGATLDQAVSAPPMAGTLLTDYPEVEEAVRIFKSASNTWLVKFGETKFYEDALLFADSTFFNIFDFKLLRGDPEKVLANPKSLILTEKTARRYFGEVDPVGKQLSLDADTNLYTVTGLVQDIPSNSHFKFDILCSLISLRGSKSPSWINHSYYTYIILKEGTRESDIEARFQDMLLKYVGPQIKQVLGITIEEFQKAGNQFRYELEPLKDIHLRGAVQYPLQPPGSLSNVYLFTVISLLILVIAIINYINLATAKSAGRAKEVGIRKVSGSNKTELISRFIGESLIIVFIASIIASMLVLALMPLFNQLTGKEVTMGLFTLSEGFLGLFILIVLTGVGAGFYPAFVLAGFNPVEVLKGTLSPGSISKKLRGVLVVFQFSVSIVIIIGAIVVHRQLNFMTSSDMGIDKENLLVIKRSDVLGFRIDAFKEKALQIPGVASAANGMAVPGKLYSNNAFVLDDDPAKTTHLIMQDQVSYGYPEALGIKLIEGRYFSKEFGTDTTAILINETAVRSLGLKDPLGKYINQPTGSGRIYKRKIIGIMKDFNIESLHTKIAPVCLTFMPGNYPGYLCIRLRGDNIQGTIREVEDLWREFTNSQPFQYSFFSDEFNKQYETEVKAGRIFILFSILAIFIACLGLIGLITFMTTIRTREVGIRKTFGAPKKKIVAMLSSEVIILIIISSLVAWPVAYFGIKAWLSGFSAKVSISPLIYLIASLTGLAIGWLSICYQAIKAADSNPAKALRYK